LKIQCCDNNAVRNLNEFSSHPYCCYSSSSNIRKSQEVLFYPGSSFEVVGVTEENNESAEEGFRVIELKQVS